MTDTLFYVEAPMNPEGGNIVIAARAHTGDFSPAGLQEYVSAIVRNYEKYGTDFVEISREETTVSGFYAIKVISTQTEQGQATKHMSVMWFRGEKVYIFDYLDLPTLFEQNIEEVEVILGTLTFY